MAVSKVLVAVTDEKYDVCMGVGDGMTGAAILCKNYGGYRFYDV